MGKVTNIDRLSQEEEEVNWPRIRLGLGGSIAQRNLECPDQKMDYHTRNQASQAAKQAFKRDATLLYPYRCPRCRGWHLTSQEKREKIVPFQQYKFRDHILTLGEDGWWSSSQLPGRVFADRYEAQREILRSGTNG